MKENYRNGYADWPIILRLDTGEVKAGRKFYGTERQLKAYLKALNSVGAGGKWLTDPSLIKGE